VGLARKAAQEARGVVLLKGPRTLVAAPEGRVYVNPTGGPSLATGGTGDVLTGTIAALLARGLAPQYAAAAGAFVHGTAGDLAAELTGEGTVASDVATLIPDAVEAIRGAMDE
jgi:NAD(P)H-hydrate epimerase